MNSFDSRTAIRITSVKGKNMINTDEYAELINKANPKYVEVKAYMFVGRVQKAVRRGGCWCCASIPGSCPVLLGMV